MTQRDIIVIGTSTGGVEELSRLMQGLPAGFPAALFIVCHIPANAVSRLPELLSGKGVLLARHAEDGMPIHPGQIYVAPPDYHLLLEATQVRLSHGPRENHLRPAIDPLFRSAARVFGSRTIGVVLTGASSDGVAGLLAIRGAGGIAVVQDPADAHMAELPGAAQSQAGADYLVKGDRLAALLVDLVRGTQAAAGRSAMDPMDQMPESVRKAFGAQQNGERRGEISTFSCPECGGALWQVDEEALVRFRCHVGHSYHADSLLEDQYEALEAALWTAVRIFKERSILSRQLAMRERVTGNLGSASRFEENALQAERYGELIQRYVLRAAEPAPSYPSDENGLISPQEMRDDKEAAGR